MTSQPSTTRSEDDEVLLVDWQCLSLTINPLGWVFAAALIGQ